MAQRKPLKTLRIGMIGAGFIARFHLESFTGVRNCAITGVYSPTKESRTALAKRANELDLGPCIAHASLDKLIAAKECGCALDPLAQRHPRRHHAGDPQGGEGRQEAARHCLREAARTQSRRGPRHGLACRRRQARHRLSGEPGVFDGG